MSLSDVPNFLCGMFSSTLNLPNPNKLSLKSKEHKEALWRNRNPNPKDTPKITIAKPYWETFLIEHYKFHRANLFFKPRNIAHIYKIFLTKEKKKLGTTGIAGNKISWIVFIFSSYEKMMISDSRVTV